MDSSTLQLLDLPMELLRVILTDVGGQLFPLNTPVLSNKDLSHQNRVLMAHVATYDPWPNCPPAWRHNNLRARVGNVCTKHIRELWKASRICKAFNKAVDWNCVRRGLLLFNCSVGSLSIPSTLKIYMPLEQEKVFSQTTYWRWVLLVCQARFCLKYNPAMQHPYKDGILYPCPFSNGSMDKDMLRLFFEAYKSDVPTWEPMECDKSEILHFHNRPTKRPRKD